MSREFKEHEREVAGQIAQKIVAALALTDTPMSWQIIGEHVGMYPEVSSYVGWYPLALRVLVQLSRQGTIIQSGADGSFYYELDLLGKLATTELHYGDGEHQGDHL